MIPFATGGFADIFGVRHRNGTLLAVKIPRLSSNDSDDGRKAAAHGIYNWSKCRHPNVHELLGFAIFHGRIGMVSPYESNGNVRYYLATNRLPIEARLKLCAEISEGVSYLHGIGIVHGDIKGNNVLISKHGTPKLTDFDNAELAESSLDFTGTGGLIFSPRWTAPEVILQSTGKTCESDVYSLGMTILASS
ncbi:Dual specificity testis-specific protein kinase 2 OS=Homo sapiens GN=TESK2 PE=1 SV=1 [Rhizoctonia solani AG-1 IB]|uniref:Dual specificity testis-specific protein kinase 2 n=1 Tax=Thanatephorus cucumeris (strain AG1-IB / isolate 7/3/14) TaxID=1108050 RepID=A0A0B7FCR8_THACB|nr:Dual specificity testis-specific protein kinase 2 OS=Homo sapiens GN=TESK2 PE=1 SV=1 [Rhizoctonia solani AG-1 IB]